MNLLNKITAIGLGISLMFSAVPTGAATKGETQSAFDYSTGESVTYYLQGRSAGSSTDLKSSQWALHNDGTFTAESEADGFGIYDDMFGGLEDWLGGYDDWFGGIDDWFGIPGMSDWFGGGFGNGGRGFWSFGSRGWGYSTETQNTAVEGIDINYDEAWKKYSANSSNKEVIVAVIDTGVDYNHEDLADSIWVNEDEIPGNGIDDDNNGYIDDVYGWNFYDNSNVVYTGSNDDHGTHCAGTIAANTDNGIGIAGVTGGKNVKVMILKALGGWDGTGETLSVVQAIKYAEANGASIVNLSFGSSYSDELLYNTMASSKMLFVVASGNGSDFTGRGYNADATPCYPASYDLDNIISVANLSYNGNLHSSSNYGEKSVDIAAPGTSIISTTPGNSYEYMTGTSMSAPFVTAAAALVYSYYDGITLSDVKNILLNSAKKLDSLNGKVVSGGMLDLDSALSYDTSKLSHSSFATKKSKGSAPELSYTAYIQNNKLHISVSISDKDNDVYALFYANGEMSAAEFGTGRNGTEYKLRNSSVANFTSSNYGKYSFYAIDSEGNETVLVINLTKDNVEERAGSDSRNSDRSSGRDSYSWRWPW